MKKIIKLFILTGLCVACSDFFPQKDKSSPTGGGPQKPITLPGKAEIDPKACDYGAIQSQDPRQQFIWSMSTQWSCPRVVEFRYYMTLLRISSETLCLDNPLPTAQQDLEHNWHNAINAFEKLAANPFGPMHAESNKLGMEIYSWPNYNKFALNAEYIKAHEQGADYQMRLASSRKGLSAIESLIYNKNALLKPGLNGRQRPEETAFNALPDAERMKARCVVLKGMMDDVASRTEDLYGQWAASGKAYPRQLLPRIQADETKMILNEISDGLIYLEKFKDYKLGLPLGLNTRCREAKCPDDVEHALSGAGLSALRANIDGVKAAFLGVKGPGFKDLLNNVGRDALANKMSELLTQMEVSVGEMESQGSLRNQVAATDKATCSDGNSPAAICRLYFQTREFVSLFKADFMSALDLQPPRTDADND